MGSSLNPPKGEARRDVNTLLWTSPFWGLRWLSFARLAMNKKTSAIHSLMQELRGRFCNDIKTARLEEWRDELQEANFEFMRLYRERFEETAGRSDVVLKQARAALDRAYRAIKERINALVIVEGADDYREFIRYWNTVIDKYALIMKQRAGRNAAKKA